MTRIVEIALASAVEGWRRLGVPLDESGAVTVGSVGLTVSAAEDRAGITSWVLSGEVAGDACIDGLPTRFTSAGSRLTLAPSGGRGHPYALIDHVVVTTPSLERTCGAIEAATGQPLKRVRDVGPGVRQGFHRFGEVIVEVVERADLPPDTPASFWGLVLVVDGDLLDLCESLGPDIVGLPKPAVQKGRFIATVRGELGLGLPVALMTP